MGTNPVVVMMLDRALAIVIGIPRRAVAMGGVAPVLRMETGRDHTRILGKYPRLQPGKQAAQDDPFDQNVPHRGSRLVATTQASIAFYDYFNARSSQPFTTGPQLPPGTNSAGKLIAVRSG